MSGHSKWSTIKRKKEITDAKRGRLFSKISKLIEVAAKKGADPKSNITLKTAIEQGRAVNMPSANIDRAIKKGSGSGGGASALEEVVYEAYGPGGVAIIITAVTDNKNRTVSEIKHILSLHGASFSGAGSVKWLFDSKFENGEIKWIPKQTIELSAEDESKLSELFSDLDEQEDISEVFTNSQ